MTLEEFIETANIVERNEVLHAYRTLQRAQAWEDKILGRTPPPAPPRRFFDVFSAASFTTVPAPPVTSVPVILVKDAAEVFAKYNIDLPKRFPEKEAGE